MKRKNVLTILIALLVLILVASTAYFVLKPDEVSTAAPKVGVKTMPPATGAQLQIPFKDAFGNPLCSPVYDGSDVTDGTASKPYEAKACEAASPVLDIQVDGDCPIEASGAIGAPSDWTKACSYVHKNGGMAYMGHSVRGPRMGAMENIHLLKIGDTVKVNGKDFKVAAVSEFPIANIPNRIWDKGHFNLVTCRISAEADQGGAIINDTVVELTDV